MSESLIGLSTIECARFVVSNNPQIDQVIFRAYNYVPNQPSGNNEPKISINRAQFLDGFDPTILLTELPEGTNIALDSTTYLSHGVNGFLLMVDLAPGKSPENQAKIEQRFREIIVPHFGGGFLLETKRSYQFLGFNLVDSNQWLEFLGRCLITSIVTKTPEGQPNIHEVIADYRYIGHSIIRGSTGLRVTTRGKKTFEPKSIAIIEN